MSKINHDTTRSLILTITEIIKEFGKTADKYHDDMISINKDETMSQSYKESRIEKLNEEYYIKHAETKENIVEKLEAILNAERECEKILDLDVPEFANVMTAINAAQGKLPNDVMQSIKTTFAGQYQLLQCVKSAFERYNVDLSKCGFGDYSVSAEQVIPGFIIKAKNIEQSESATFIDLKELFNVIIYFGETRGLEFDEEQKTFEGFEKASDLTVRQAMGLPLN